MKALLDALRKERDFLKIHNQAMTKDYAVWKALRPLEPEKQEERQVRLLVLADAARQSSELLAHFDAVISYLEEVFHV